MITCSRINNDSIFSKKKYSAEATYPPLLPNEFHYAQINQITSAPDTAAISVKGTPILRKSFVETLYPSFCKIPMPAILADAPIGVMLPPRVAPMSKPKANRYGSVLIMDAMLLTTGSMVAT